MLARLLLRFLRTYRALLVGVAVFVTVEVAGQEEIPVCCEATVQLDGIPDRVGGVSEFSERLWGGV